MAGNLAYDLHVLISLLDRSADQILRGRVGISYRRFLALLMLDDLGPTSQRALADRLGTTEPSVSRMTGVLAREGWLQVSAEAGAGNRRRLELTDDGRRIVADCSALLEELLAGLVRRSGVSYADYLAATERMRDALSTELQRQGVR